ncbi:hypothetical protein Bca4012_079650 [Brassica carinata]
MGVSGRRWKTASSQSVAILGEGNGDFSPVVAISDEGESAIVSKGIERERSEGANRVVVLCHGVKELWSKHSCRLVSRGLVHA